jgi:hypothetical protein
MVWRIQPKIQSGVFLADHAHGQVCAAAEILPENRRDYTPGSCGTRPVRLVAEEGCRRGRGLRRQNRH